MFRVAFIFLFSTLPALLCAQKDDADDKKKKAKTVKEPARFKVVKLGEPVVYFGKYTHNNEVQKTELAKCDTVSVKYCFNLPSEFRVLRFRMSACVGNKYYYFTARGNTLTPEMKELLGKLENGCCVKIRGVVAAKKTKRDSLFRDFGEITLKVFDNADTSLITYKLKNKIPEPDLFSVKSQLPSKVTRLDLMFVDQLLVKCDCKVPALSTEFRVVGFDLRAYHNGDRMVYTAKGSDLTQEMRDALIHAKTGTKFRIENIRVKTADGLSGYLRPRTFKVIP
jgi:hypothetical protein